jgi:hypothetical protein
MSIRRNSEEKNSFIAVVAMLSNPCGQPSHETRQRLCLTWSQRISASSLLIICSA